jgi:hypothetical protein
MSLMVESIFSVENFPSNANLCLKHRKNLIYYFLEWSWQIKLIWCTHSTCITDKTSSKLSL